MMLLDLAGEAQLFDYCLQVSGSSMFLAAQHHHSGGMAPLDQHLRNWQLGPPD
jgi:hypothetical protein